MEDRIESEHNELEDVHGIRLALIFALEARSDVDPLVVADWSFADIPVLCLSAQERQTFTGVVNPSGLTPRTEQSAC